MKLCTVRQKGSGDTRGVFHVASDDGARLAPVPRDRFTSLLHAVEEWKTAEGYLRKLASECDKGSAVGIVSVSDVEFLAPLPRAYNFVDGSGYINHIILARKARGALPPDDVREVPMIYQHNGDNLVGATSDIVVSKEEFGIDFEAEVGVITTEVARGATMAEAERSIALVVLFNDVSLRNLIPKEIEKGFGFYLSKPCAAFSPFAATLDELGDAWRNGRIHLAIENTLNGTLMGNPSLAEAHFTFADMIAYTARTRNLGAGSIVGGGTVSNADRRTGVGCLAERRAIETIETGAPKTPFMKHGDVIEIDMKRDGRSICGSIRQKVVIPN